MKHYVGIDMGTQSMRGFLFNPEGELIADASSEYLPVYPQPGWAECDAGLWLDALKTILAQIKAKAHITAEDIGTIAFACIDASIVPVDENCNPIDNCIIWMDSRTGEQADRLSRKISEEDALHISGSPITPFQDVTKIMWIRENKPEIYKKARYFCEATSFFVGYLTGTPINGYCGASYTQLFDIRTMTWSDTIFQAAELDMDKMFDVRSGYDIAGTVRPGRAEELGLSVHTRVVVGDSDHQIAMLGSGMAQPGQVMDISGTSTSVSTYITKPVYDPVGTMLTHISADGKYWTLENASLITGGNLRWYKDTIARCGYNEMDQAALAIAPGSDGLLFLPFLQGQITPAANSSARGVFFGLTMNHDIPHMTHAVYEANVFTIRDCIEVIQASVGKPDVIIGTGGGTRSALCNQMKADCFGIPFQVMESENATGIGAGMIAGAAAGLFAAPEEAIDVYVKKGQLYEPNPAKKAAYDEAYAAYLQCQQTCQSLFRRYQHA
ncbi:MAG TPA: hypothetical protein IAA32_03860 [Candidatus Butyricicoccus stercorigallinarum]|nr:hypothetical protein [Candidatus Butyricicoccus stercorigallinarum]